MPVYSEDWDLQLLPSDTQELFLLQNQISPFKTPTLQQQNRTQTAHISLPKEKV